MRPWSKAVAATSSLPDASAVHMQHSGMPCTEAKARRYSLQSFFHEAFLSHVFIKHHHGRWEEVQAPAQETEAK